MEFSEYVYIAKNGETFDSIALAAWGNERYAAELIGANPLLCGIMVFQGGEELRLPMVELTEDELEGEDGEGYSLPEAPWKE